MRDLITDATAGPPRPAADVERIAESDLEVLRSFARGLSIQETATELHMSRSTVTRRMAGVRSFLKVETNIEAVVAVVRGGLI